MCYYMAYLQKADGSFCPCNGHLSTVQGGDCLADVGWSCGGWYTIVEVLPSLDVEREHECVMQICPKLPSISLNLAAHAEAGSVSYHIYPLWSAWDVLVIGTDVLGCFPQSRPSDRAPISRSQSFEEACALPSAPGSWLWPRIIIQLCSCAAARWGSGKVSLGLRWLTSDHNCFSCVLPRMTFPCLYWRRI